MRVQEYIKPDTLEDASRVLHQSGNNVIVAGCTLLRNKKLNIDTAIDLSRLGLRYITVAEDHIEIGAMATLRDIEVNAAFQTLFSGMLPKAVQFGSVQFRNMATVGATVYCRFGLSDLLTALVSLEAEVVFFRAGKMKIAHFLKQGMVGDILEKVIIPSGTIAASFQAVRKAYNDFALLNAAIAHNSSGVTTIVVGARPGRPEVAVEASRLLTQEGYRESHIYRAAAMAAEELNFIDDLAGSREYRRLICAEIVCQGLKEVFRC